MYICTCITYGDLSCSSFSVAGDDEVTFDPDEIIENIEQVRERGRKVRERRTL